MRWEKAIGGPTRVRVSPELIRVEPGAAPTTKWQQPFDASLTDVFQVQADIATKVASALNAALGDSARHELAAKPTANLAAYDAYLKGEAASQAMAVSDPASLRRAFGFYQQAVALDSGFVPAWTQLARAYARLYFNGTPTPELAAQAREAANRAQALGPDRPEGQLALGDYYQNVPVDNRQALAAYEAGLKLAPTNVDLLVGAALAEQRLGRWETALQYLTQGDRARSPLGQHSPAHHTDAGVPPPLSRGIGGGGARPHARPYQPQHDRGAGDSTAGSGRSRGGPSRRTRRSV